MIAVTLRAGDAAAFAETPRLRRCRFGLDAPLPAEPGVIERAILRHLAEQRPDVLVLRARGEARARDARPEKTLDLAAGVPEILLLLPGGRLACLKIKTQAQVITRAQRAFADLCRERAIPLHVVRSLPEAVRALDALLGPSTREKPDGA